MSYIVTNRVPVKAAWHEEFERRFRARAGQIDAQPGFVRMRILRPTGEATLWVVETEWESEAAFRQWIGSDDFRKAHADPMPKEAFDDGGGLEQFDVVIDSDHSE